MSQMPLSAVASANALTAGSPSSTQLSVSAALDFNGQPVNIATGNLLGGTGITLIFSLTNPVAVGDLADFIQWAAGQFGVTVTLADITGVVDKIPLQFLKDALESVLTAQLTITILNVSIQPGAATYAQVAANLAFDPPIGPTWLNLTQVGFMLTQGQASGSP
ncbi:MAG: hypothetical protein JWM95_4421 [Gemmatimonadetes bacterium]|nr:hypothetical protein [Gemmatimonadota bacterium]